MIACASGSGENDIVISTLFPVSFLAREKDPGWVWSRGTHILSASK